MFVTWTCYAVLTRVHLDWTILYLCRYLTVKLEYQWQAGKKLCHARNGLSKDFKYKKNGRKDLEDKNYLLITGIFGTSLTWLHDDCTVILFIYSVEILLDVMYICRQLYKQPVSANCDALGWKGKVLHMRMPPLPLTACGHPSVLTPLLWAEDLMMVKSVCCGTWPWRCSVTVTMMFCAHSYHITIVYYLAKPIAQMHMFMKEPEAVSVERNI